MTYDLDRSLLHTLHRAWQATGEYYARQAGVGGLTPRQLAVMTMIAANEGPSQVSIVTATGIDRSTIADIIHRLQREGLISRTRSRQDARRNVLRLTVEGKERLKQGVPIALAVDEFLISSLTSQQAEVLSSALQRLIEVSGNSDPARVP